MKIGLVAPVKPSHPYLENDPAPLFDLHYRRLAPWLWFRASDNAKAGGTDNVFPPMQGWSGSGCDLSSGKLPQVDLGLLAGRRLKPHRRLRLFVLPPRAHILRHRRVAALVPQGPDLSIQHPAILQPFPHPPVDMLGVGVQLRPPRRPHGLRRLQNLPLRRQGYQRTVLRDTSSSWAIPRIERPAPFIS